MARRCSTARASSRTTSAPSNPAAAPRNQRGRCRSLFEGARDMARHITQSDAGRPSRRQRKKVEMLFAHLKRILCLGDLVLVVRELERIVPTGNEQRTQSHQDAPLAFS